MFPSLRLGRRKAGGEFRELQGPQPASDSRDCPTHHVQDPALVQPFLHPSHPTGFIPLGSICCRCTESPEKPKVWKTCAVSSYQGLFLVFFSCFVLFWGGGRGVTFRVLGGKEAQVANAFCPPSPGYTAPALAGGKKHPCCSPCLWAPLHPPLHSPRSPNEPPPCSKFSIPRDVGP